MFLLQYSVAVVSYVLVIVSIALSGYQCLETDGISFNSAIPSASATSEGYNGSDNGREYTVYSMGNDSQGVRETEGNVDDGGENGDTDMQQEAPVMTDQGELLTIEICNNGAYDGQMDFNDPDCRSKNALPSIVTEKGSTQRGPTDAPIFSNNTTTTTPPSGPGVPEICGDGIDNNGFDGIDEGCLGLQNRFPGDIGGVLAPEGTESPNGW